MAAGAASNLDELAYIHANEAEASMETLYKELRMGLCQFYEDPVKAEKYIQTLLQTDMPVGCSLIREEHICRVHIQRPDGEL